MPFSPDERQHVRVWVKQLGRPCPHYVLDQLCGEAANGPPTGASDVVPSISSRELTRAFRSAFSKLRSHIRERVLENKRVTLSYACDTGDTNGLFEAFQSCANEPLMPYWPSGAQSQSFSLPLEYSIAMGSEEMFHSLLNSKCGLAYLCALAGPSEPILSMLIEAVPPARELPVDIALHFAVRTKNRCATRLLLRYGASPEGIAPLNHAEFEKNQDLRWKYFHTNVVPRILGVTSTSAELDRDYLGGLTWSLRRRKPIQIAFLENDLEMVELLCAHNANVNVVSEQPQKCLLESGLDMGEEAWNEMPGMSLLVNAIIDEEDKMVALLLRHGADPNETWSCQDNQQIASCMPSSIFVDNILYLWPLVMRSNPLEVALDDDYDMIFSGRRKRDDISINKAKALRLSIVDALIQCKADLNAKRLDYSTTLKSSTIIQSAVDGNMSPSAMGAMAHSFNSKLGNIRWNFNDRTHLMHCARRGRAEQVAALVSARAEVNAQSAGGHTALHWSLVKDHYAVDPLPSFNSEALAVIRILLDAKADPDITDNSGQSAFKKAAAISRPALLSFKKMIPREVTAAQAQKITISAEEAKANEMNLLRELEMEEAQEASKQLPKKRKSKRSRRKAKSPEGEKALDEIPAVANIPDGANELSEVSRGVNEKSPVLEALQAGDSLELKPAYLDDSQTPSVGSTDGQQKVSSEDDTCVICLEGNRSYMIAPCGHLCLCVTCVELIVPEGHCPICRASAPMAYQVYKC